MHFSLYNSNFSLIFSFIIFFRFPKHLPPGCFSWKACYFPKQSCRFHSLNLSLSNPLVSRSSAPNSATPCPSTPSNNDLHVTSIPTSPPSFRSFRALVVSVLLEFVFLPPPSARNYTRVIYNLDAAPRRLGGGTRRRRRRSGSRCRGKVTEARVYHACRFRLMFSTRFRLFSQIF